ncbi:MAG: hypothetical protein ABW128_19385 [Rhizorhabdus sp.]
MSEQQYRRLQRLPDMLCNARRKVAMLEAEAERHGFKDLLERKH